MEEVKVRRAEESDIEMISKLLYEVHQVHSDVRPDLFQAGMKKYDEDELEYSCRWKPACFCGRKARTRVRSCVLYRETKYKSKNALYR